MIIAGFVFIIISLGIALWWVATGKKEARSFVFLCLAGVFVGLFLLVQGRVTELTFPGIGTIKTAAKQAKLYANDIQALKERLEAQSAIVELVAKHATDTKELYDSLVKKNALADEKLRAMDGAQQKAFQVLSRLEHSSEFTRTVLAAQNDDRRAFDKLKTWADDKSYAFCSEASDAWRAIREAHSGSFFMGNLTIPWPEGTDPSKLSLAQLRRIYALTPALKLHLIEYIWKREDIPRKDRMEFLVGVIKNDEGLKAVEHATRYFIEGAGLKIKPMVVEDLLIWWEKNKDKLP